MKIFKRSASREALNGHSTFVLKPLAKHIHALVFSTLSLALVSPHIVAQEEDSGEEADVIQEEVVIVGIRASQRGAIELKKAAGTMSDSIIAEDVSKFPDKNVTEALQRIPGVQISRDFGEGSGVSIRGMEAGLTRIEVDGVSALGMGSGGRGVALTDMASELVKTLTVVKGSEARIAEGGIGGTVQLELRKANDFDEHFFSASFEEQYNDLSKKLSPKGNLTGVYKFTDDFGVMLNFNASDKHTLIHALRNTEWARWADYDNSSEKSAIDPDFASFNSAEECNSAFGENGSDDATDLRDCEAQWWDFGPGLPRYGNWERQEKRISSSIGFGWEPTDALTIYGDYTFNQRDKRARDWNLQFGVLRSESAVDRDSVVVDENHNIRALTTLDAPVQNRSLDFSWLQETSQIKLGADYFLDNMEFNVLFSFSESNQDIDARDTNVTSRGVAGVRVVMDEGGAPQFNLNEGYFYQDPRASSPEPFQRFDINDPASYNSNARYRYSPSTDKQQEGAYKFDFAYNFDDFFITKVRAGGRYSLRSLEAVSFREDIDRNVGQLYADPDTGEDVEWTLEDQTELITGATEYVPEFFHNLDLGVGIIDTYAALVVDPIAQRMEEARKQAVSRNQNSRRGGAYYIEEETYAGYAQVDFEQDIGNMVLWGNTGVRFVSTDNEALGDVVINTTYDVGADGRVITWDQITEGTVDYQRVQEARASGSLPYGIDQITDPETGNEYGQEEIVTFQGEDTSTGGYSDLLPSLNLNLGVIPDVLNLYFGASKVLARPRINVLNINANCRRRATYEVIVEGEDIRNTCTSGNPDIKPYRATQMDFAVMWYPNDDSLFSASIFTKDLTVYLGQRLELEEALDPFAGGINEGEAYYVTRESNIEGVSTKGFEIQGRTMFSNLPGLFSNTGIEANYTYMTADDVPYVSQLDGSALPLIDQSENSYNLSAFYEDEAWTVKLAYNFREGFLRDDADRGGNPVFRDDAGQLDAKVSYQLGDSGLTVYADVINLLGEIQLETAGAGKLTDLQWSGRVYSLGVTYKM